MTFGDGIKSIGEALAGRAGMKALIPRKAETPISTWKEFKDWIEAMAKAGRHFWYRGVCLRL